MPVVIGWSAVTGRVDAGALVLFGVIFLWTPPHTWALAMRYRDDYATAGVPMLPVVAPPLTVARRSAAYSWVMVAVSLLLVWPLGVSGALYGVSAVALGAVFLRENALWVRAARADDPGTPMRLFHWSITYLALLFLAVAVDQLV
jgi:protoheme IX farnesyltransferase